VHHAIKIKYQVLKNPLWEGGDSEDISVGGIRVIGPRRFPEGLALRVQIFLPERPQPITAQGHVVWRKDSSDPDVPGYEIGIKFIEISSHEWQELSAYLQRVARKQDT
jgi:hypothetical protein